MKLERAHARLTELQGSKRGGKKMTGGASINTDTDACQVVLGMTGQTYPIYYTGQQGGVHTFNTMKPGAAAAFPAGQRVVYVNK